MIAEIQMPHRRPAPVRSMIVIMGMVLLTGCGGGGSGPSSTPTPPAPPPPPPPPVNYNTTEYQRSEGPSVHGAITAYDQGYSGAGITIGVVDTGIATASNEFTGRISAASAAFNGATSIEDEDGHGTAVASVLAAARNNTGILGMAWGSTILALRTDELGSCATDCNFFTDDIARAIDHARLNGATVINMSLGGDSAPTHLRDAVNRATAAGIILVLSAGNDGLAAPDGMAAQLADPTIARGLVIIAASSDSDGTISSFSNRAAGYETATLTALGNSVLAPDQNGVEYRWSGTSFSAPHIAGAIALMRQAFPNLTPAQIVARLMSTADDAGAVGDDAVYGQGILNLTRAFAATATSLASTSIAISTSDNGSLSVPMGDASASSSATAVVIDTLGRAYTLDPRKTFASAGRTLVLSRQMNGFTRDVALDNGPVSMAFNLSSAEKFHNNLAPSAHDGRPVARLSTGSITSRISSHTRLGLAYGQGSETLLSRMGARGSTGSFLAASDTSGATGAERNPAMAFAASQKLSPLLSLHAAAETGHVVEPRTSTNPLRGQPGYSQFSLGLTAANPAFHANAHASYMTEQNSLLGARLASIFTTAPARTLFLDVGAGFALRPKWQVAGNFRRGWTHAAAGGSLGSHARLASSAWSLDLAGSSLFQGRDRLSLRLSQPLRVTSGGLNLNLPTSYDYATSQASWTPSHISLAPKGRQIDGEASYATPFGKGWLMLNGYWRRQDGNIATAKDIVGGALRFKLAY